MEQTPIPNSSGEVSPLYREIHSCNRRLLRLMRSQKIARDKLAEIERRLESERRLLKALLRSPEPAPADLGPRLPGEHD